MPLRLWKAWIATGRETYYTLLEDYSRQDVEGLAEAMARALRLFRKKHGLHC